jgi:hypothetical protein
METSSPHNLLSVFYKVLNNDKWEVDKTMRNGILLKVIQTINDHDIHQNISLRSLQINMTERLLDRGVALALRELIPVLKERLVPEFEYNLTQILINILTQRFTDPQTATNSYQLTEKERLLMSERFLTDLTVIISHPHACSKQVSVGFGTKTWDTSDTENQYVYTTGTCPGSSGAVVFVWRMTKYVRYLNIIHSGGFAENKGLNFGCKNVVT